MLDKLVVRNFKCHETTEIDLKNLTLLVGTNSSGKSSIIQSLLLLIHNITNPSGSALNGHLVSVGYFSEARNLITNAKSFELSVTKENEVLEFKFVSKDDKNENAIIQIIQDSSTIRKLLYYTNSYVHYLSAHRIGGQDLYLRNFDNYDMFGLNGEYAIDYFQHFKSNPVDEELRVYAESETLESQVNYWLDYIFEHTISTSSIAGTDKVKAEYVLKTKKSIRPKNIGSGVSYLISILIVCLASKNKDIIILENPEIHLHPKAQSTLAEFLVLIANAGRQLIIETHSDHIYNGIRVGINNAKIDTTNVSVNFFTLNKETSLTSHTLVKINSEGRILNSKSYLFDQFENDINSLLGIY